MQHQQKNNSNVRVLQKVSALLDSIDLVLFYMISILFFFFIFQFCYLFIVLFFLSAENFGKTLVILKIIEAKIRKCGSITTEKSGTLKSW